MIGFIKKNKKIINSSLIFSGINSNIFCVCSGKLSGKPGDKTNNNNSNNKNNNNKKNTNNDNDNNNNDNDNKEKIIHKKTKDNNEDPLKTKKDNLKNLLKKVKEENNKLKNECKENITIDDNFIDSKTKDEELKEIETNLNIVLININNKLEKEVFKDFTTKIKNKDNFGDKIEKGSNNTIYKAKCNGKYVIFSGTSKKLKSRYNMDYIIKNTIINGLFSNIQPKIYNEYFCDYIENGQFIEGNYDIFRGIQVYNKANNDKKQLCIDDNIKNKLLLQQIVFSTGDQGVKNQIYNIEESNDKRIIKNVVFIDLDDELRDELDESLYDNDRKVIFDKDHPLNEETQKELVGIFNNLYDIILNKLDNNVKFAIDSNIKYERHNDYGKEKINEFKYFKFCIFEKNTKVKKNIFDKFKDKEKILSVDYDSKDFYELKCKGDDIFVKYKETDEFTKIENEGIRIYAKIDNYISDERGDTYVMSGDEKVKIDEIFTDKYVNIKECKPEMIDFNTALKAFKKHYLQYGYNKIQSCISSGFFPTIKKELEECAKKYKEKIDNFDKQ